MLTEQEQRIAIAEACGWRRSTKIGNWYAPNSNTIYTEPNSPPDYLNDLNAMHEAEKTLQDANKYQQELCKITVKIDRLFPLNRKYPLQGFVLNATAKERAETFLKTIGKWKP